MLVSKPRVLIFIDWFYPGFNSGGPVQSILNMTEHLKQEFDFYIITRDTDYCASEPLKGIKSDEWNLVKDFLHVYYISKKNLSISTFIKLTKNLDVQTVYINGIYSWWFSILPVILFRNRPIKKIIGVRGMLAAGALKIKTYKKNFFLSVAKKTNLYKNVVFHVTNKQEEQSVKNILGEKSICFLASNLPNKTSIEQILLAISKPLRIVNIARISPEKNLLQALTILQTLNEPVVFDIYGPIYNQTYWNQCLQLIRSLPNYISVNYKGVLLADDVLDTLKKYHLFFMPTLGENFGHIILQSFMASTPVLISNTTPWKNLSKQKAGFDLPLSDVKGFIEILKKFNAMDNESYLEYRKGAYQIACQYLSDKTTLEQNLQLLKPY
jgi:glycosyltransferase involved in cell wall biosynthesis